MTKKNLLPYAYLFFCAVLYLIWPTVGTIALRKVLLLMCALAGIKFWLDSENREAIVKSSWLIALGMLLAWVVIHATFVSQNGAEAWREFVGQWLPPYLSLLAGIGLALAGQRIESGLFKKYLLIVLAAQPVLFLLVSIYKSFQLGHPAIGFMVVSLGTDLKTSLTFSSDMMAAFACASIFSLAKKGEYKKIWIWLLPIALGLFVAIFASSLNSILLIMASVTLLMVLLVFRMKQRVAIGMVAVAVLAVSTTYYVTSKSESIVQHRERMISTTRVALDIDGYPNWQNFIKLGLPKNNLGETVPESFYLRVAYAKAGMQTMLEHPWGYGVTRQAFERLEQMKYPDASISSAHNGYLNLALAVGIPGLIFLCWR